MKEVAYGYRLRQARELLALTQQRTQQLDEVLGELAPDVSAEWDRNEDGQGRPIVTLRLGDFAGSVTTVFEPKELESPEHVRIRVNRLWRDLLRVRTHFQLKALFGGGKGGA